MLIAWLPELLALQVARAVDSLASFLVFGTLLALATIVPKHAEAPTGLLRRLLLAGLAAKLATGFIWLPLQAIQMAGPDRQTGFFSLAKTVALETTFGQALFYKTVLVVLAVLIAGSLHSRLRVFFGLLVAAAALTLQTRLGHAAAQSTVLLTPVIALHVLAAGAWIGSLPALAILVSHLEPRQANQTAGRFSIIGIVAVLILIETSVMQSILLIGGFGGWFGTPYGQLAILKVLGLILLLVLATVNRFLLTPQLINGGRALVTSVAIETAIGVAVVFVAAQIATTAPGAHAQPVWPFPLKPDLSGLGDAYIRKEAWRAGAITLAVIVGIASLFWRKSRFPGPVLAAIALWYLPVPNLRLLADDAVPTSYARSVTGYTASSIAHGEKLLRTYCTSACTATEDNPTDLTPYNIWGRSDGDLFDWLVRVFDRIGHSPFAHGTIAGFSEEDRWSLIDAFRARVSGSAVKADNHWRYTIPVPDFIVTCAAGPFALRELPPGLLRLVLTSDEARTVSRPPEGTALTTVLVEREEREPPTEPNLCRTALPEAWTALSIAGGFDGQAGDGAQFIVDGERWMRSRILPGEPLDADEWRREITLIEAVPLPSPGGGAGGHAH